MHLSNERLNEVLRIRHDDRHHEKGVVLVRKGEDVLFQSGVSSIRDAILAQVPGEHMSGYQLHIGFTRCSRFRSWRGCRQILLRVLWPALPGRSTTSRSVVNGFVRITPT